MRRLAILLLPWLPGVFAAPRTSTTYLVYIGTHALGTGSPGIFAYRFAPASGEVRSIGLVKQMANPFFLAVDPGRKYLYAGTIIDGRTPDSVTSFAIDRSNGALRLLNSVSSRGTSACYLVADHTGKMLMVADYADGKVAAFSLHRDGRIGETGGLVQHHGSSVDPERQSSSHPHAVVLSPDNRFAFVPDLGLDQIRIYRIDPVNARLTENDPPFAKVNPGSGPRHMAFAPDGKFAYVVNELQSTVTVFAYDAARGSLAAQQTVSTLPPGYEGKNTAAEIEIDEAGLFVYASNRGHDSIVVFSIDQTTGMITPVAYVPSGGREPWSFKIDPTGGYLLAANKETHNVVIFRLDPKTGLPKPTGKSIDVPSPVCLQFVPAL
jgi:6-phosphogluconolactonase